MPETTAEVPVPPVAPSWPALDVVWSVANVVPRDGPERTFCAMPARWTQKKFPVTLVPQDGTATEPVAPPVTPTRAPKLVRARVLVMSATDQLPGVELKRTVLPGAMVIELVA